MKNKTPVIFIGHGSPMNIVAKNDFTESLKKIGQELTKPKAIVVLSAHWQTEDMTLIHNSTGPQTIYDFYGFPEPLYQVDYSAEGAYPVLEKLVGKDWFKEAGIKPELTWGLDHGAWAVLHHMFPNRDVPVTQISINPDLSYEEHFKLAGKIAELRKEGVLILASGNIVHNLRTISWTEKAPVHAWAQQFEDIVRQRLTNKDWSGLVQWPEEEKKLFAMAHPSDDHYLPLLYALGASEKEESVRIFFDEIQNASISMLSFIIE